MQILVTATQIGVVLGALSSVGVDVNCAVIGYTATAPTANLAPPAPGSQFPPR